MTRILYTLLLLAVLVLTSCSNNMLDDVADEASHVLSVNAVSFVGDIAYPVEIYAYDSDKTEVAHVSLTSSDDDCTMVLPSGTYSLSAVSGSTDFTMGYQTKPLMLGQTEVQLEKDDVSANVIMKYAVAQLDVELADVPDDATDVTVGVSSLYNSITQMGELGGSVDITLPCSKGVDGKWRTATVYVLPGCADNTVFAISHTIGGDEATRKTYSYVYDAPLKAATPYHFKGSYNSGISYVNVSFVLSAEGWNDAVDSSFEFGEGAGPSAPTGNEFHVSQLPALCTVWNGHVIAAIDENGNALLISKQEWENVHPALTDANAGEAAEIAATYTEDGMIGWTVPTNEQMQMILDQNRKNNFGTLSQVIADNEGKKLQVKENLGYLCSAAREYCDLYKKRISATSDNATYCLRLVKSVCFVKE